MALLTRLVHGWKHLSKFISNGLHIKCIHKNIFFVCQHFSLACVFRKRQKWLNEVYFSYISCIYLVYLSEMHLKSKSSWWQDTRYKDELRTLQPKIMQCESKTTSSKGIHKLSHSLKKNYREFSTYYCLLVNMKFWMAAILRK